MPGRLPGDDLALKMEQELLAEHEKAGTKDGYVFEELAELLTLKHRGAEARPFFAKAYEELAKDSWLREKEAPRLERLRKLGGK